MSFRAAAHPFRASKVVFPTMHPSSSCAFHTVLASILVGISGPNKTSIQWSSAIAARPTPPPHRTHRDGPEVARVTAGARIEVLRKRPDLVPHEKSLMVSMNALDSSGGILPALGGAAAEAEAPVATGPIAVKLKPPRSIEEVCPDHELHRNYSSWGCFPQIYLCWLLTNIEPVTFFHGEHQQPVPQEGKHEGAAA